MKTFFALDLALCVAAGIDFHGRKVKQGPVVYVLGEGRGGLKKRVSAWLQEHQLAREPDAFFVTEAVQFRESEQVEALLGQIGARSLEPAMVVIDTFARCSVGVTENDATEVGVWIDVHVLRHTFCSHLAMRGAGARAIQELAGHRDLATTQRYMHVSPSAIESAIRLLDGHRSTVATSVATSAAPTS